MSKYHNKKVYIGEEVFDSRKEYNRYLELLAMEKAGEISDLQRQVKYELIPAQKLHHPRFKKRSSRAQLKELPVNYIADFVYKVDGETRVEDVKGIETTEYILKRKLMLFLKGIQIDQF